MPNTIKQTLFEHYTLIRYRHCGQNNTIRVHLARFYETENLKTQLDLTNKRYTMTMSMSVKRRLRTCRTTMSLCRGTAVTLCFKSRLNWNVSLQSCIDHRDWWSKSDARDECVDWGIPFFD